MNDFRIVIPTHRRVGRQVTLQALPKSMRDDVLLVVSDPAEKVELLKLFPNNEVIVAKRTNGIASKRHWIMKNVDVEKIFMMDDDMYFFKRAPLEWSVFKDGGWQLKEPYKSDPNYKLSAVGYATDKVLRDTFKAISKKMGKLAHVGLSSKRGNNRMEPVWAENYRMMHAIGYRRDAYLQENLNFGQVKYREDFNITLHLLRRGYPNMVYFDVMCSPLAYGAAGGASDERTVEASDAEAEKLARVHKGFVKVVQKEYDNVPRKEVIVYWKKAYESSIKN